MFLVSRNQIEINLRDHALTKQSGARMRAFIWMVLTLWPVAAIAEMGSLIGGSAFDGRRVAVLQSAIATRQGSSLFAGKARGTMFAPTPVRTEEPPTIHPTPPDSAVDHLRRIIGRAESPRAGYDAVQHGARRKPNKLPTQMTLGEIYDWIAATPGQPHAIGRYQFIPPTLRRVAAAVGARRSDRFSPQLQDRLADVLLAEAGFAKFRDGRMSQRRFIDNLAGIWAGLPASDGRSKYHGYAGNRATITLAEFRSALSKIAPG